MLFCFDDSTACYLQLCFKACGLREGWGANKLWEYLFQVNQLRKKLGANPIKKFSLKNILDTAILQLGLNYLIVLI